MSTCESIREELVAYLDGELPAQDAASIQAHLAACGACLKESQALESSWRALESLTAAQPGAGSSRAMALRILEQVSCDVDHTVAAWPSRQILAALAIAAAVLVAIGVAWPWSSASLTDPSGGADSVTGQVAQVGVEAEPLRQIAISNQTEILEQQELLENLEVLQELELLVFFELLLEADDEDLEAS